MKKVLVIYYSQGGNTELVAAKIANVLEADLIEVRLQNERIYKGFLKYLMGGFQVMTKQVPAIMPLAKDPKNYDLIFVGSPMWNRGVTPAIRTLLSNLSGLNKKIYFFYTQKGNSQKLSTSIKHLIEPGNIFGGALSFRNVKENQGNRLVAAEKWATQIIDEAYEK